MSEEPGTLNYAKPSRRPVPWYLITIMRTALALLTIAISTATLLGLLVVLFGVGSAPWYVYPLTLLATAATVICLHGLEWLGKLDRAGAMHVVPDSDR